MMDAPRRRQFARFSELTARDINRDLHVHTTRTDGKADVKTIMRRAYDLGLAEIAFTEHVRKNTGWFDLFLHEVEEEKSHYPGLSVLIGCESKAVDRHGTLDISDAIMDRCEIILGSVHRFPDGQGGYLEFGSLGPDATREIELELALGLLRHAPIDVLAHPAGMYLKRFGDFPEDMVRKIMLASLERDIAVEINSSYLKQSHAFCAFLRLCSQINPYVSVGSDMHQLEQLAECRNRLLTEHIGMGT